MCCDLAGCGVTLIEKSSSVQNVPLTDGIVDENGTTMVDEEVMDAENVDDDDTQTAITTGYKASESSFLYRNEFFAKWSDAVIVFTTSVPQNMFDPAIIPNWKSINDRYKNLLACHRIVVTRNAIDNGIIEVHGGQEIVITPRDAGRR